MEGPLRTNPNLPPPDRRGHVAVAIDDGPDVFEDPSDTYANGNGVHNGLNGNGGVHTNGVNGADSHNRNMPHTGRPVFETGFEHRYGYSDMGTYASNTRDYLRTRFKPDDNFGNAFLRFLAPDGFVLRHGKLSLNTSALLCHFR
jgi:hypothetical protein